MVSTELFSVAAGSLGGFLSTFFEVKGNCWRLRDSAMGRTCGSPVSGPQARGAGAAVRGFCSLGVRGPRAR